MGLTIDEVSLFTGYDENIVQQWEVGATKPSRDVIILLATIITASKPKYQLLPEFRFIDLFAGIGGMRKAFENVGGKCVYTSEWDKFARETYQANYKTEHKIDGDITKVDESEIPSHDLLLAGFPCQPFSLAGVSKKNSLGKEHGFRDKTQGTLFFDIARILRYHKPSAFLLENVKNLKSHDKGKTFKIICETLTELGYYFDWRIINAKSFLPQNRERIFIAGFRSDHGFQFSKMNIPSPEKGPLLKSILHPEDGSEISEPPYTIGKMAVVADKYTLTPNLWSYLQGYAEKHRLKGNGFGFGLVGPNDTARTLSARYHKDGSEILIEQKNQRPRRLTPRECSRLMGFDNPNESNFKIPVSDTQAYRQFGNSVAVPVVKAIAEYISPYLASEIDGDIYLRDIEKFTQLKLFEHYNL